MAQNESVSSLHSPVNGVLKAESLVKTYEKWILRIEEARDTECRAEEARESVTAMGAALERSEVMMDAFFSRSTQTRRMGASFRDWYKPNMGADTEESESEVGAFKTVPSEDG